MLAPYIDLHETKKKIDLNMEREQGAHNNHWGLNLTKVRDCAIIIWRGGGGLRLIGGAWTETKAQGRGGKM